MEMETETVIITFQHIGRNISEDLEVPLDIATSDLVSALTVAYELGIDTSNIKNCYLKAEKPIVFLKGGRTLREMGIRNGSRIIYAG